MLQFYQTIFFFLKAFQKFFFTFLLLLNFFYVKGQNLDVRILRSVYNSESSFKDKFFKADAQGVVVFNIAVPISIFTIGTIKHDKRLQRNGLFIAGAFVFSAVATQSLKALIKRERPFVSYPYYFADRYDGGGYSFPSGHVSAAFCTATSLSIYFPKWYVVVPAYIWAGSVGWARMYQGVHYPSDVLAGAMLGAGSAWAGYFIQKYVDKKHLQKQHLVIIQ
jgi:membrane-associated phospholipid phosphatase